MTALEKPRYSEEEYLILEETSLERHEYFRGEILEVAEGSPTHDLIGGNLCTELNVALRSSPCRVHGSDLKLKIEASGLMTYADVSVVYEESQFLQTSSGLVLLNPQVIFEVLSKSTAGYDRGEKFAQYRQMPSLREYVLVSQYAVFVEHFTLEPDGRWALVSYASLEESFTLETLNVTLSVRDLYLKVDWE